MSFGLSLNGYQFYLDRSKLQMMEHDPLLNSTATFFVPDATFGIQFTTPYLTSGMSISDLFQSSLKLGDTNASKYKMYRNLNLHGGYKIEINRFFMIEPAMLIKFTKSAYQIDISSRLYYRDSYWGGLAYRTGANTGGSLIFLSGVKVDKYYIGYAFDYTFSRLQTYSLGSHEFMFSLKFGEKARRYRWLNKF
jgi:type IX secretion system PorP/SprF family membrane protein